jgi:hypothetical protein
MSGPHPDPINASVELVPFEQRAPCTLCDTKFVATLGEVEERIKTLKITDAMTAQAAADLLVRLTRAGTALESAREALVKPLRDRQKLINDTAKPVANRIDVAKGTLKAAQTAYDDEQQRKAAKLEADRQAELKRLEKLKADEDAAAAKKAKDIADAAAKAEEERLAKLTAEQKAQAAEFDFLEEPAPPELPPIPAEKSEVEKKIEAIRFAPAPVVAKAVGITYRTTLRIKSVDVMKLPEIFITRTAKMNAISAAFCTGWKSTQPLPVLEGCVFEIDKQPISTGKAEF